MHFGSRQALKHCTNGCAMCISICQGASGANVGACGIVEAPYQALLVGLPWPQYALGKARLIDKVGEQLHGHR